MALLLARVLRVAEGVRQTRASGISIPSLRKNTMDAFTSPQTRLIWLRVGLLMSIPYPAGHSCNAPQQSIPSHRASRWTPTARASLSQVLYLHLPLPLPFWTGEHKLAY
jgi:hypothetical protein